MTQIHSRYRQLQLQQQHADAVHKAIQDAAAEGLSVIKPQPADATDARRLRGIPVVGGRGAVGGAIAGTRPDTLPFEK